MIVKVNLCKLVLLVIRLYRFSASFLPFMKVCVVGAGVSGLTAIKHLLEYGLEVVCYEAGEHVGGLWRYNPDDRNGKSLSF